MRTKGSDLWVFAYLLPLMGMGLLNLWSASQGLGVSLHWKQLLWILLGSGLGLCAYLLDYRHLEAYAYPIYALGILLLCLLWVFGVQIGGAKRWIALGGVYLQPSEFAKLAVIVALSKYLSGRPSEGGLGLSDLLMPLILVAVPAALVALQPDLGTALVFVAILGLMALYGGIRRGSLLILMILCMILSIAGWSLLKDYQRKRILAFLDPQRDPLGTGYHLIQSKIAIGSGGLLGKGIGRGSQCKLGFLPEFHTDFAFALWGEEWGFIGSAVVLLLFLGLILWGLDTALRSKDRFGSFMALGITALLFLHVSINVAMALGLLPVVGLPLPFFSYGGSCTVASLIGIGLLLNIRRRRHLFTP